MKSFSKIMLVLFVSLSSTTALMAQSDDPLGYGNIEKTAVEEGDSLDPPEMSWSGIESFSSIQSFENFNAVTVKFQGKETKVSEEQIKKLIAALENSVSQGRAINGTLVIEGKKVSISQELRRQTLWWKKALQFAPTAGVDGAERLGANEFVEDSSIGVDTPEFDSMLAAVLIDDRDPESGQRAYTTVRTVAAIYEAINDNVFKYNTAAFLSSSEDPSARMGAPAHLEASVETVELNLENLRRLFPKG